ncbi:MAG: UMP kinase [archaeon]
MFDESIFPMAKAEESTEQLQSETQPYYSNDKLFVLSVGGSILVDEKPKTTFIAKFAETINELSREGYKFCLVVGGGKTARNYVAAAKNFGATNYALDKLGIVSSRLNALLLIQALENAYPTVMTDPEKATEVLNQGKIPVFGGLYPGITTDAVASLVAEALDAKFINLTNVDGVYTADPNVEPHAKLLKHMSYEKLLSLIRVADSKPSQHVILDLPCCLIIRRSSIHAAVLNGNNLDNLKNYLRGLDFVGTTISEEE